MRHCSENKFCAGLDPDVREALCACCVKATYAAASKVNVNFKSTFLVVNGLCVLEQEETIDLVIRPGDFAIPPDFDPASSGRATAYDYGDDVRPIISGTMLHFVKDTLCANFQKEALNELLDEPRFARAMYANLKNFTGHAMYFHTHVANGTAYDAVRHVLRFARTYDIGPLTHAQIAYLAGRSRSTVTQAMHEVALQEPELL